MTISLNMYNYQLYEKVIIEGEQVKFRMKNGVFYIDGRKQEEYTFTKDYYFFLGDNRINSSDSRYYGFIPKEKILGRVDRILFSSNKNVSRKNNFFTEIDSL